MHGTNLTPCIDDMTLKPYCIASHLTFSAKVIPTQYLLQDWELNKPVHEKKNKTAVVRFRYFALKQLVAAFKRTTWESVGLRCSTPPPPPPPHAFPFVYNIDGVWCFSWQRVQSQLWRSVAWAKTGFPDWCMRWCGLWASMFCQMVQKFNHPHRTFHDSATNWPAWYLLQFINRIRGPTARSVIYDLVMDWILS